jgi:hypothetical protein
MDATELHSVGQVGDGSTVIERGRRLNGAGAPRQRANGHWEVRFYVSDPRTGLRKRMSAYGETESDATESMHLTLDTAAQTSPPRDAGCTVRTWAASWCRTTLAIAPVSDADRTHARDLTRAYLTTSPLGRTRLKDVELAQIREFLQDIERRTSATLSGHSIAAIERRAVTDATVRSALGVLYAVLATAVRDGLLAENPAATILRAVRVPTW